MKNSLLLPKRQFIAKLIKSFVFKLYWPKKYSHTELKIFYCPKVDIFLKKNTIFA